jgi:hypothetical protein
LSGLLYTYDYYRSIMRCYVFNPKEPYFLEVYRLMAGITTGCLVLLLVFSLRFLWLRTGSRWWFAGLMLFEIAFTVSISVFWLSKNRALASSVGGATGVATGGLVLQDIVLFPLWAPFAVLWAHRRIIHVA